MWSQQNLLMSACVSTLACCSSGLWISNCNLMYTVSKCCRHFRKWKIQYKCSVCDPGQLRVFFHINQSDTSNDTNTLSVMLAVLDPQMPTSNLQTILKYVREPFITCIYAKGSYFSSSLAFLFLTLFFSSYKCVRFNGKCFRCFSFFLLNWFGLTAFCTFFMLTLTYTDTNTSMKSVNLSSSDKMHDQLSSKNRISATTASCWPSVRGGKGCSLSWGSVVFQATMWMCHF